LSDIMPVSELEKKAESTIRIASKDKSNAVDVSFNGEKAFFQEYAGILRRLP
jgi:hypothetical protein